MNNPATLETKQVLKKNSGIDYFDTTKNPVKSLQGYFNLGIPINVKT